MLSRKIDKAISILREYIEDAKKSNAIFLKIHLGISNFPYFTKKKVFTLFGRYCME